jgi:hypothetical protein
MVSFSCVGSGADSDPRQSVGIPQSVRIADHGLGVEQATVTVVEVDNPTVAAAAIELLDRDEVLHSPFGCGPLR